MSPFGAVNLAEGASAPWRTTLKWEIKGGVWGTASRGDPSGSGQDPWRAPQDRNRTADQTESLGDGRGDPRPETAEEPSRTGAVPPPVPKGPAALLAQLLAPLSPRIPLFQGSLFSSF